MFCSIARHLEFPQAAPVAYDTNFCTAPCVALFAFVVSASRNDRIEQIE
jgi:hypothetical protein